MPKSKLPLPFRYLSGQKFNRLYVICISERQSNKNRHYLCRCDCGKEVVVGGYKLLSGATKSCGCYSRELASKRSFRHGASKTRIYSIWGDMIDRCANKNNTEYKHYGERGISVCEEWKSNFIDFKRWADANGYEANLTIERLNVNGNYDPSNCCWIAKSEQVWNRRVTLLCEINGEILNTRQIREIYGIPRSVITKRLKRSWKGSDLIKPVRIMNKKSYNE